MNDTLLVIDLSAIAHMMWHVSTSDADPNSASIKTIERVRALASGQPHAVICCDHPSPSFRREIDPLYKANRKAEDRAPLYHQMRLAIDALKADGFPVLEVKGAEADDLIGSIVAQAPNETAITVSTRDKDILQCVTEDGRVVVKWLDSGNIVDADAVFAKLGVRPFQVADYLCLCGDSSDNVKGAEKVGPKTSASLLGEFGTLQAMFAAFDKGATPTLTPNLRTRLQDFRRDVWPTTRQLIALRTDIPIDFTAIFAPRVPTGDDVAVFGDDGAGTIFTDADAGPVYDGDPTDLGVIETWSAKDMQNRPTREEVASVREAMPAMFGQDIAEAFTPADARAEIEAAFPPNTVLHNLPSPPPHAHYFNQWMPTLQLWRCACGQTQDQKAKAVGDIAAIQRASEGASNAARTPDTKDRETGSAVVRDDALRREDGRGPVHEQPDAVSGGEGRIRGDGPDTRARTADDRSRASGSAQDAGIKTATDNGVALARPDSASLTPVVVEYERQLEPRDLAQAYKLATSMFQARLFSAYGNADAVLSTILAGREFGMPALASLRAFHVISGKVCMAADTMRALVLRSGAAEYLRCKERTAERCTFVTKRRGDVEETSLAFTIEEARAAFTGDDKAWKGSGYGKNPADLLVARASSKLCRLVYPDVISAIYDPSEIES